MNYKDLIYLPLRERWAYVPDLWCDIFRKVYGHQGFLVAFAFATSMTVQLLIAPHLPVMLAIRRPWIARIVMLPRRMIYTAIELRKLDASYRSTLAGVWLLVRMVMTAPTFGLPVTKPPAQPVDDYPDTARFLDALQRNATKEPSPP